MSLYSILSHLKMVLPLLLKHPLRPVVVISTLALVIGANTIVFALVNVLLIQSLPFKDADRLVLCNQVPLSFNNEVMHPDLKQVREQVHSFEDIGSFTCGPINLTETGNPERLSAAQVSSNFFELLGYTPVFGRSFSLEEEQQGKNRVAVLSYGLWKRRFGADPATLGKSIHLNGESVTVIGVAPAEMCFPEQTDVWVPFGCGDDTIFNQAIIFTSVAHLKKGVSLLQAQSEFLSFLQQQGESDHSTNSKQQLLTPLRDQMVGNLRPTMLVLLGSVFVVLLIACANIGNMGLVQAIERRQEFAVRAAVGAKRNDLVLQLFIENLLLAFVGGGCGLIMAWVGLTGLTILKPLQLPSFSFQIDWLVFGFTLLLSVGSGLLFGLIPVIEASTPELSSLLNSASSRVTANKSQLHFQKIVLVAETTLAVVLLIGAGVLVQNYLVLQSTESGIKTQNVLTVNIGLPSYHYQQARKISSFYEQLVSRLEGKPGIKKIGLVSRLPMGSNTFSRINFLLDGHSDNNQTKPNSIFCSVNADYFTSLGIPLQKGRFFNSQDTSDSPKVLIVNESFSKQYFSTDNPIGKRIGISSGKETNWFEIIGVVGNVRSLGLQNNILAEMYFSFLQKPSPSMTITINTEHSPMVLVDVVREQVLAIDTEQPIAHVKTMEQIVADSLAIKKYGSLVMIFFAGFTLILTLIGIYGIVTYSVKQRNIEIGIRFVLGSNLWDLQMLLLKQSISMVSMGISLGVLLSEIILRTIASLFFGFSEVPNTIFFGAPVFLLVVALIAIYVPVFKATRSNFNSILHN